MTSLDTSGYFGALRHKVFILGIGAQKAGTTWLHRYLTGRPGIFMPPDKELHYFDAVWRPDLVKVDGRLIGQLKDLAEGVPAAAERVDAAIMTSLRSVVDRLEGGQRAYADFFRKRVTIGHTHFGEITPSYAMLPIEGFRQIRDMHPDVRIIFLMRDPVDRIASAARMVEREQGVPFEAVRGMLLQDGFVDRTRYDRTIARLRAVFAADKLFFGFYETLFRDETIRTLCEFLGIAFVAADYGTRVNEGRAGSNLSGSDVDTLREAFAPVYAFCREEFGSTMPSSWLA